MKKRSLFSAVAMLIVSAIVLTSATYAWFAAGTEANVSEISATITNSDGSILLSADGGTQWLSTIGKSSFSDTTGSFTTAFVPVSVTPSSTPTVVGGSLDGTDFYASEATAGAQYTEFSFKLKTSQDATVTCEPAFSTAVAFGYALVIINGNTYLYGSDTTRSYQPIKYNADLFTDEKDGSDTSNSFTMDEEDEKYPALNDSVTPTNTDKITINTSAGQSVDIRVLVWAEGQDAACHGSVNAQAISIAFKFTK